MGKINSVLIVCAGNSCRSPMAEGLLKKYLKDMGKHHIRVESAGVVAVDGFSPTDKTIEVMKEHGIDISYFKSKQLTVERIKRADVILVMEPGQKDLVKMMVTAAADKTFLLKEFGRNGRTSYPEDPSVPDPMGKPIEYYKLSFEIIKTEIERIAKLL